MRIIELQRPSKYLKSDFELDATGLVCPEPLMLVRNKVREMEPGQVLHVLATDPTTKRDLDNFCHFMKHQMLATSSTDEIIEFWIKNGL